MEYLIGVDLGTTATKAVLFQPDGTICASSHQNYILERDTTGKAEEDFEAIFSAVLSTIHELSSHLTVQDQLLAVSFSTQMHALMAFDAHWQPLTKLITWADTRSSHYSEKLKQSTVGQEIYQKTGTPIHPMAPLSKLLWLKAEKPAIYQAAAHYLELKGAIFHRLFAVNGIDLSTATGTGLFNIFDLAWEQQALELTGITPEQLPQVLEPYTIEQGMKAEFAQQMGIPADTKFVWGAADGPLANLGANAIQSGVAALTIGTSGAIRVGAHEPKVDSQGRTFTYALDKTHWVIGGPVNSGGDVFRWLRDSIFEGRLSFDEISQLAEKISAGADGLLFHPYLGGERAPLWQADARGSFFGLNYSHTPAHMARSVLEGIIFNLQMVAQSVTEVTGPIRQIQATGGFTSSNLWLQILADIFEQDIFVPEIHEAGCLAAVVMAKKALGLIDQLEEVV